MLGYCLYGSIYILFPTVTVNVIDVAIVTLMFTAWKPYSDCPRI